MVEKTRRALAILQQRTLESPRLSPQPTKEMHNYINEILLQSVRSAEERIADIKRKTGRSFRNKALSYLRLNKKKTTKKRFFDIN